MQPWITQGSATDHGGTVVTSSPFTDIHGIGVARKGDMVVCPRCKGTYPIVEGDETLIIDGAAVAYQGCKTLCGATLIAAQATVTLQQGSAAGGSTGQSAGQIAQGVLAAVDKIEKVNELFSGRFRLLDASGEPLPDRRVRIVADGVVSEGTTDADGYTEWVEQERATTLHFELIEEDKDV